MKQMLMCFASIEFVHGPVNDPCLKGYKALPLHSAWQSTNRLPRGKYVVLPVLLCCRHDGLDPRLTTAAVLTALYGSIPRRTRVYARFPTCCIFRFRNCSVLFNFQIDNELYSHIKGSLITSAYGMLILTNPLIRRSAICVYRMRSVHLDIPLPLCEIFRQSGSQRICEDLCVCPVRLSNLLSVPHDR